MRYIILFIIGSISLFACKKNNGNTAPVIKFKSITPSFLANNTNPANVPILTIELKDAEGDIGFNETKDTSYVYIKNLNVPPFVTDSFKFPSSISTAVHSNFKADIDIDISKKLISSSTLPHVDTLYFEVFVKDFGKNKSNVIKTDKPLYLIRP
jgi:hypothetical protein